MYSNNVININKSIKKIVSLLKIIVYYISMKSVFEYIDYRKFLASYYNSKKDATRFFSYRYFARKAMINSPSFLKHVIDGKRNLTRPMIEKFCVGLELTAKESVYFRNLVLFNQAKTSGEKQEHYSTLRDMFGGVKESVLSSDQYDYFAQWYNSVVRELICMFDLQDDYKRIASMVLPPILPSEAKSAIKLLLRLKLVHRRADGAYVQTNSAIVADNSVTSMAVRSFNKAMLELAKNAVDNIDRSQRHVSGLTVGISPASYDVLAAEIEAFKDRVKVIVSQDKDSSLIYQMNITLFPVSRPPQAANAKEGPAA
jgi:uncharacterized protein (TIGR02147 family)